MTSQPLPEFAEFEPLGYLELCRRLASDPEPVSQRTAADRAYYAAFLYGRNSLFKKGYITPYWSIDDHQYVTRAMKAHSMKIGDYEQRLRRCRNAVTYDTRQLDSSYRLGWMLDAAQQIVDFVRGLPDKSTHSQR